MAFFDKVQQVAKNAVSSAEDMIETQKLNMRINDEQKKIKESKLAIGELVWQSSNGNQLEQERVDEQLAQIRISLDVIAGLERQIAELKDAPKEAAPSAAPLSPNLSGEAVFCTACGVRIPADANFCPGCGQGRGGANA